MSELQPVWKKAEGAVKYYKDSDNEKHCIAASPRQIKTQIAKISYTMKTPTKKNKAKQPPPKDYSTESESENVIEPAELETRKICSNDNTNVEFIEMKKERDQEIKNLNTYLTEIINNNPADKTKLTENGKAEVEVENNVRKYDQIVRRCRTEVDFRPVAQSERHLKTRVVSIIRSKSSHPPDTKSHELLPSVAQNVKRKSYNVEEARKFLKDQKRRRRFQQDTSALKVKGEKTAIEKEEIKKRLEKLRKNSRAIITKNVNKKKNSPVALDDRKRKEIKVDPDLLKNIDVKENNNGEAFKDLKTDPVIEKNEVGISDICPTPPNDNVIKNAEDKSISNSNLKSIIPDPIKELGIPFPEKRIGLLRKPETKDHSFSAIREYNFDKENIALEMLNPKFVQSVPLVPKTTSNDKENAKDREEIREEVTYRKPTCDLLHYLHADELKNPDLSKVYKVDSNRKSCDESNSKREGNTNITVNNLPYWLKPSTVQIYPYNFIMAVRRKLEALADVRQTTNQIHIKSQKTANSQIADKTSLSRFDSLNQPLNQKADTAESKYSEGSLKTIKTDSERIYTNCNNSNIHPTQSQSEINSNLSSISVQLLQSSNNELRTSSNKTNSNPLTYAKSKGFALTSEDDTTISSSIFNSPERIIRQRNDTSKSKSEELHRAISPLSLERVENLTIMSSKKLKTAIAAKHVNPNRGDAQTSKMEQNLSHNQSTSREIDFNQLLNDFNRSLSQVIEVNDRLKTTINKSHEICGTTHTENNSIREADDYTTDFEKCSSHRTNNSSDVQNEIDLQKAHIENYSENEICGLKYGDNQTCKEAKNTIKFSHESQQECDEQLNKIIKSKMNCISSRKYGLSKVCYESSEIYSVNGKHNTSEIQNQENSKRAEHLTETLISTNISDENGCDSTSNIQENIRSKTENENKQKVETPKKSTLSERKKTFTSIKHEDSPYQQNFLSENITASHKILEMFDYSNLEISLGSVKNDSLSDSTCSYSNVGMYEKLIRNETTKSEHLTALLKMREKALFDRTKGQIAWLEVQKERCKSKGLLLQIAAIKKKQRGILLKMEKEREEIKRLLQSTTSTSSTESTSNRENKSIAPPSRKPIKSVVPQKTNTKIYQRISRSDWDEEKSPTLPSTLVSNIDNKASDLSQQNIKVKVDRSEPVVRANYTLETSRSLEELLKKRELDLQRRREHVERLMQWHRRLDQEEAEVLQMENKLLRYNTHKSESKNFAADKTKVLPQDHAVTVPLNNYNSHVRVQRRLKEINNSLKELNSISSTHTTAGSNEGSGEEIVVDAIDCVRTTGAKLNKLWRRLTSQQFEKYVPDKRYELSKTDLEHLYEAAKVAVLKDFSHNESSLAADLLENSIFSCDQDILPTQQSLQQQNQLKSVLVPSLKLCTSSESSDKEGESCGDTSVNSLQRDNYSPSIAAEKFQHISARSSGSGTLSSVVTQSSSEINILLTKITSSMRNTISNVGLVRSLSDGVLYSKDRLLQAGKQESLNIYKEQCAELNQKNSSGLTESPSKQVLESHQTHENNNCGTEHVFAPAALNYKNVYMEEKMAVQNNIPNISNNKAANDDLNVSSKQQDVLSSFHHNSVCVSPKITTTQYQIPNYNNNSNSSCANLDSTQNDNDNSCSTFTDLDSIKSQPLSDEDSFNSKTFISQPKMFESDEAANANCVSKSYDDDFESSGELTQIDDLSLPHFESIVDVSFSGDNENNSGVENVDLNHGEKDNKEVLSNVSEKPRNSQSQQSNSEIVIGPPPSQTPADNVRLPALDSNNGSSASSSIQLMPDIINELEIRRCQQILIEPEKVKQFDNVSTVLPYMYVREIPNKPPPPYVPPAHGSPMTTIFPSEERIREISYRRTHELYCELLKTDYITKTGEKLPTVMDEKITNIYERIILDICREYLDEHSEVLTQGDPDNFHTQLAFFNPPNRLHCIQESIYKEVRRCLAMDKTLKRRTPIYSVYGQRANRDHIGKIIIQEMYDEDDKWCNFHREENEVVDLIISEMVGKCLNTIAKEVLIEENGTVDITCRVKEVACEGDAKICSHETELKQTNNSVDLKIHDAQ
ncbi:centrosome-associated protein 350-like isoform X1 [Bactrocera neohumeralis]|uniref:centrosome-associated protein 350-like isoform X1 n=1 Tax=Bactrocera neohumeralis TaxID=98809 RepID=UPI0021665F15|nr:centrosome-associated protein 350-like isoform X1 [Bactrocera neohumeralis]